MKVTKKILSGTAALCAIACLSAPVFTVSARSGSANTNNDYSRDSIYPNRSDRSVMDQKRDRKKDMTHKKDMMKSKLSQSKVREVQEALDSRGYAVGEVDGLWGPRTSGALKDFQSNQGIEATGRMNTETFNALGIQTGTERTRGSDTIYSE